MSGRYALRLAAALTFSFMLLVGAMHALSFDSAHYGGIHDALTPPDGCTSPCFMGIRPGITTRAEALALLAAHPWVARVGELQERRRQLIRWRWNGQQPAFLSAPAYAQIDDGVVQAIILRTDIDFGDLWVAFGAPHSGQVDLFFHVADYRVFSARTFANCNGFWDEEAEIYIGAVQPGAAASLHAYNLSAIRRRACQTE